MDRSVENVCYFHLYANGSDARNFIVSEDDFRFQFNLVAICVCLSGVKVLAFSIEDTHPHFILVGTPAKALDFKVRYETSTLHHIRSTRGTSDGVTLDFQLDKIENREYLMNACAYVIIQPTKDGKGIMPYDYRWGTGSMYFRPAWQISLWRISATGAIMAPVTAGRIPYSQRIKLWGRRNSIPSDWMVCDGLILPDNYVDVAAFESIFVTHNCFRTFQSAGKKKEQEFLDEMSRRRGVRIEDFDAREICKSVCRNLFGKETARWLSSGQRLELAKVLRYEKGLTLRQIATLSRLPNVELEKYLK